MKHYKFLDGIRIEQAERFINDYAREGWVVNSFNVVAEGECNQDKWAYVLLEWDEGEE